MITNACYDTMVVVTVNNVRRSIPMIICWPQCSRDALLVMRLNKGKHKYLLDGPELLQEALRDDVGLELLEVLHRVIVEAIVHAVHHRATVVSGGDIDATSRSG